MKIAGPDQPRERAPPPCAHRRALDLLERALVELEALGDRRGAPTARLAQGNALLLLIATAYPWLALLSEPELDDRDEAAALYDALLRPLEGPLAGATRLLVSPDGGLSFLPFEALLRAAPDRTERAIELGDRPRPVRHHPGRADPRRRRRSGRPRRLLLRRLAAGDHLPLERGRRERAGLHGRLLPEDGRGGPGGRRGAAGRAARAPPGPGPEAHPHHWAPFALWGLP